MNIPNRAEDLFIVADKKIYAKADTKVKNTTIFTIKKEDHTVGNLIKMQLHRDPQVLFSGYRMPHPLEHDVQLRIQTTDGTTPLKALDNAIKDLLLELDSIENQFRQELERVQSDSNQMYA